jgi:hypothetical protein
MKNLQTTLSAVTKNDLWLSFVEYVSNSCSLSDIIETLSITVDMDEEQDISYELASFTREWEAVDVWDEGCNNIHELDDIQDRAWEYLFDLK